MSGRWVALGVLCTSLLAIVVDNTIVNVALPTLVPELDADVSELQWVVDAYTLVFAGLLLLAGALGDRYGRRRTLLVGLVVFAIASAAAAYAGGVDALIACRAVMGAGAAFIMPATLSLLVSVFPDERERAHGDRHLGRHRRPRRRARARSSAASCSTASGGGRSSSSTCRCAWSRSSSGAASSPSRAIRSRAGSTGRARRCRAPA